MHTSELSHCRLKSSKETYARRGVATVHLVNHNNTLAGIVVNLLTMPIIVQVRLQI